MDWNDLRYFATVARTGGLSSAARQLKVSPQTVGRRVAALEADIGATLFLRGPTGYHLTDEGRTLAMEAERVEDAVAHLRANVPGGGDLTGVVRLAAPETIVASFLLPGLRPILDRYRKLELEILGGTSLVGIARGEADLALRVVRPERGALTVRQVGRMAHHLVAAPALVESGDPVADMRLVGWTEDHGDLPAARWMRKAFGRSPNLRLNSLPSQRAAIEAGFGIGLLPAFLGEGLVRIEHPTPPPIEPLWLVAHAGAGAPERIRMIYDAICAIMEGNRHRLAPDMTADDIASPDAAIR